MDLGLGLGDGAEFYDEGYGATGGVDQGYGRGTGGEGDADDQDQAATFGAGAPVRPASSPESQPRSAKMSPK